MDWIHELILSLYNKYLRLLQDAPPGTLQLTGILGLALLTVGYYHFFGEGRRKPPGNGARDAAATSSSQQRAQHAAATSSSAAAVASPVPRRKPLSDSALAAAVFQRWCSGGVKSVSVSMLGCVLTQSRASHLRDGASLLPHAREFLREAANACSHVFLIVEVDDDVGEAAVRGALEAAGVLAVGVGCIAPHRLLFCSSVVGKVSMVRQLSPDLHIDCDASAVEELARFNVRLLHITGNSKGDAAPRSGNVAVATDLPSYFLAA